MGVYQGETVKSVVEGFSEDIRNKYLKNATLQCATCGKLLVATSFKDEGYVEYYTIFKFVCPDRKWYKLTHRTTEYIGFMAASCWSDKKDKGCDK
jgi:hypothetical protein